MDSFEFNKVAGAVLGTALGVMVLSIASDALFASHEPEKPGMHVEVADAGGGEAGAPAAEVTPIRSVDRIQVGSGGRGPITEAIQKEYMGIAEGRLPDRYGWRTMVPAGEPASA